MDRAALYYNALSLTKDGLEKLSDNQVKHLAPFAAEQIIRQSNDTNDYPSETISKSLILEMARSDADLIKSTFQLISGKQKSERLEYSSTEKCPSQNRNSGLER